jgi:hypothetical protein
MSNTTDTILRVSARDLFLTLSLFNGGKKETTLENIRLRFCIDRKMQRKGDYLWSRARDAISELRKLNLVEVDSIPRDREYYQRMKDAKIVVSDQGRELLARFSKDRAGAYDDLFTRMFNEHPYMRALWQTLSTDDLVVPVATSLRDHVSPRYGNSSELVNDIAAGRFDFDQFRDLLSSRLSSPLRNEEQTDIERALIDLIDNTTQAAKLEEPSDFAKKFLDRLNETFVPIIMRRYGVGFDFRTHRTLWSLGQEYQVWWATSSHPDFSGTLIFSTASLKMDLENCTSLVSIEHPTGIRALQQSFLERLYHAYLKHKKAVGNAYVPAWELRAVFCHENRCQPGVFNNLLGTYYAGSEEYRVQLEIERTRPRHEAPVIAGRRRIGSIAITKP